MTERLTAEQIAEVLANHLVSQQMGDTSKRANLRWANLSGAEIEFHVFPSIRTLSSIQLGTISETLAIELMRRDAWAHPHPERFQTWAEYGDCPYNGEEYFWHFDYKSAQKYWKPGNPEMRDSDLILEICKEKGWKIKGY